MKFVSGCESFMLVDDKFVIGATFMAKCLIVYYSLGGTTERIADKITIGLESTGYEVDKFILKDGSAPSM